YQAVVLGDSRVALVGSPRVANPTQEDKDCERSSDSLATIIARSNRDRNWNVLNLACSGASLQAGLLGPQARGGRLLPPQVSILKQVEDVKLVVVAVGPNDFWWADTLKLCYSQAVCNDLLTTAQYQSLRDQFIWDYNDLLGELRDLPSHPQVIITLSYDVFDLGAKCADAKDIYGNMLGDDKISLFLSRNADLNTVLSNGAEEYGFDVAKPHLTKLCQTSPDGMGPQIQGLKDPQPFHPT